jgi:hypothetical protein
MADEVTTSAEPVSADTAAAPASQAEPAAQVPTDPKAYHEWRYGSAKPPAESAPAKKSDAKPKGNAEGDQESGTAAESEPAKAERQPSKAERRLNELLEDLKRAGLSPSELKTFKREARAAQEEQPKAAPERTVKAPAHSEAPKKPKQDDFDTWEKYEDARDKYFEDLADFKARHAVEQDRHSQRQEAAQKEMSERLTEAKKRYGDEAETTIVGAAQAIFQDQAIPGAIREVLNESSALVDVLYALGKDESDLDAFVEQCRTDPGAALRKAVLVEKLVLEELGKSSNGHATPPRDGEGKFVAQGKRQSTAPPPARQVSGTAGPPVDETARAVEKGDFTTYRELANRRDLARFRGQ